MGGARLKTASGGIQSERERDTEKGLKSFSGAAVIYRGERL